MPLALLDEDREPPAEFPVAPLGGERLAVAPGGKAAADMPDRNASLRQQGEAVERLGCPLSPLLQAMVILAWRSRRHNGEATVRR